MSEPFDCNRFRQTVTHFQADELPETERRTFLEHVDRCADCARRLEFEESFLRGIKRRLTREPLPPGLETRVRASLDGHSVPPGSRVTWIRGPWFAVAATALLLTILLVSGLGRPVTREPVASIPVEGRRAVLVDLDCARAGRTLDEQRKCRHPEHINALEVGEGTYWNISLEDERSRGLVLDREKRGLELRVSGVYYPQLNTVRLERIEDLQDLGDTL